MKKIFILFVIIIINTVNLNAQSSFGLSGFWNMNKPINTLINSLESNPSNYLLLKDWGLEVTYGGEFSGSTTSNLYLISLSKRLDKSNFTIRYTPGYEKEFLFNSNESIVLSDSTTQTLSSNFKYKELFAVGYSYQFSKIFSIGFSSRFFTQEFNQEIVEPVFSDSLFFNRITENEKRNFWRGDFGINYLPFENLSLSVATLNLINIGQNAVSNSNDLYELRRPKGAILGASFSVSNQLGINFKYETTQSFIAGVDGFLKFDDNNIGISVALLHDKYQKPYINGIVPSITYQSNNLGITFSAVKYINNRNISQNLSDFQNNGINNIINNRYSFDKATLTIAFNLNTLFEPKAKIISLKIVQDIFPAFEDNYIDKPFAIGKVVNETNKKIVIKPSSKIIGFNKDKIYSPSVVINSLDTVEVPFYTIVPDTYSNTKNIVSYANFYINSVSSEIDDKAQNPILINKINAWDGKVIHLKEFIKKDQDFLMAYAKEILSNNKSMLDTVINSLSPFYTAKILFDNLVKKFVYVADQNASADYVQFPRQTIKLKGGDCDDLSVLYSGILESVGIQTALIDYKPDNGLGHVNILFNTELSPQRAKLITDNDSKYFIRKNKKGKDQVWITIETTSLTNFMKSWELGTEKFNDEAIDKLGLAKGRVEIIDIQ